MEEMADCIDGGPRIEPNDFIIEVSWKERYTCTCTISPYFDLVMRLVTGLPIH